MRKEPEWRDSSSLGAYMINGKVSSCRCLASSWGLIENLGFQDRPVSASLFKGKTAAWQRDFVPHGPYQSSRKLFHSQKRLAEKVLLWYGVGENSYTGLAKQTWIPKIQSFVCLPSEGVHTFTGQAIWKDPSPVQFTQWRSSVKERKNCLPSSNELQLQSRYCSHWESCHVDVSLNDCNNIQPNFRVQF